MAFSNIVGKDLCISGVDCRHLDALDQKEKTQVMSLEQPAVPGRALGPELLQLELLRPDGRIADLPLNSATIPCLNGTLS